MFDKNRPLALQKTAGAIKRAAKSGLCLFAGISFLLAQTGTQARATTTIAVLDLTGDGSVSDATIQSIGDKIIKELSQNKNFAVYDKENVAFILEQLNPKPSLPCPDMQCFSDLGNQLGADQIVVGSVSFKGGGKLRIELERVDAVKKRIIRGVKKTGIAEKEDFLENILPELVEDLMSGDTQNPQITTPNKTGKLGTWAIGAGASAAIAAGVAAIILTKKTNQEAPENQFLLDPPSHTR